MDISTVKNNFFTQNDTYSIYVNDILWGVCKKSPDESCKIIADGVISEIKKVKPHYIVETIDNLEEKNRINILATSPGIFKNSYYEYTVRYEVLPTFVKIVNKHIEKVKEGVPRGNINIIETVSHPVKDKLYPADEIDRPVQLQLPLPVNYATSIPKAPPLPVNLSEKSRLPYISVSRNKRKEE